MVARCSQKIVDGAEALSFQIFAQDGTLHFSGRGERQLIRVDRSEKARRLIFRENVGAAKERVLESQHCILLIYSPLPNNGDRHFFTIAFINESDAIDLCDIGRYFFERVFYRNGRNVDSSFDNNFSRAPLEIKVLGTVYYLEESDITCKKIPIPERALSTYIPFHYCRAFDHELAFLIFA